jgi:hypothetical protein
MAKLKKSVAKTEKKSVAKPKPTARSKTATAKTTKTPVAKTASSLLIGLYVRLLKKVSDTLLSIDDVTDNGWSGSDDNYWQLIMAPYNFAKFCLALCPSKTDSNDEWKKVLSILYNKKSVNGDCSKSFLEGEFVEIDGTDVRFPKLSDDEQGLITPWTTKLTKKMEKMYKTFPDAPDDKSLYDWRRECEWVDHDNYRQDTRDAVEYITKALWAKIMELKPLLREIHQAPLTPPTTFQPVFVPPKCDYCTSAAEQCCSSCGKHCTCEACAATRLFKGVNRHNTRGIFCDACIVQRD